MGTALGERKDVVNFLGLGQNTSLEAFLAEGVGRNEPIPDALPGPPVPPVDCWVTTEPFILLRIQFGVFLTESAIGQLGAARIRARPHGFVGHGITSNKLQLDNKSVIIRIGVGSCLRLKEKRRTLNDGTF